MFFVELQTIESAHQRARQEVLLVQTCIHSVSRAAAEQFPGEKGGQTLVLVVVLCLLVAAFAIGMVLLYWRALPPQRKPGLDSAHLMEAPQHPQSPTLDMDSLKIQVSLLSCGGPSAARVQGCML